MIKGCSVTVVTVFSSGSSSFIGFRYFGVSCAGFFWVTGTGGDGYWIQNNIDIEIIDIIAETFKQQDDEEQEDWPEHEGKV